MKRTEINGVIYVGEINKCNDCETLNNLVEHHIQYEPIEIIKILCRSCHIKFHKKYPDEHRVPKTFERGKSQSRRNKWTSISVSKKTKEKIEKFAPTIGIGMTDSWDDLLLTLLKEVEDYQIMKQKYFKAPR